MNTSNDMFLSKKIISARNCAYLCTVYPANLIFHFDDCILYQLDEVVSCTSLIENCIYLNMFWATGDN